MNWTKGVLQDLVFLQRGFDITKDKQEPGDIPVISSSGITSYHSKAMVVGPGVIIGRKGTLGTVFYSKDDYWPHDTTLWSKDLRGNNAKFVYYFLKGLRLEHYNVGNANPTLNRNHIHNLPIFIPDRGIQDRIVEFLSNYDDLIENNHRRITLLEQSARLLHREWFVYLRFPGHEHVKMEDGVLRGWKYSKAIDVIDVMSGGTPKTDNPEYWQGNIPFFTPKDITDEVYVFGTEKQITEKGLESCSSELYPENTIFITARGTVGRVNIAQIPMAMNQSCYALKAKAPLNQVFLYFALGESVKHLRSRAGGAVFDAIIRDTFKHIPFTVPTEDLILLFTDHVNVILQQVRNLLSQNRKLIQARDLLLPRLINGEIAV